MMLQRAYNTAVRDFISTTIGSRSRYITYYVRPFDEHAWRMITNRHGLAAVTIFIFLNYPRARPDTAYPRKVISDRLAVGFIFYFSVPSFICLFIIFFLPFFFQDASPTLVVVVVVVVSLGSLCRAHSRPSTTTTMCSSVQFVLFFFSSPLLAASKHAHWRIDKSLLYYILVVCRERPVAV